MAQMILSRPSAWLAVLLTAGLVAAQSTPKAFVLPSSFTLPGVDNKPFASVIMRYQQWYSAAELFAKVGGPARFNAIEFKAGTPGGQAGKTVDVEVAVANGPQSFTNGSFAGNMVSGHTVVFPRGKLVLGTAVAGTFPVLIPFASEFVWDGSSGLVVDIKLFDNGNNNQPFPYDLELAIGAPGKVDRMWTLNNPNAAFAAVHRPGEGLTTRFTFYEGVTVPYGAGCKGDGGFVPEASTSGGHPLAGNTAWTQHVSNAPSQRPAMWLIGDSRTKWGALTLPHELVEIAAFGCFLLAKPVVSATTTTIGGGAGAGQAKIASPLPPVTTFVGQSFFSQWLILDPNANNGILTASHGLWHIIGQ